jgi:histone acetyltransferase (RNA polymerase elongator complex component)
MSHANIPIFVPHAGCPNTCVFCNQHKISGHGGLDISQVEGEIERALSTRGADGTEIAFFGGSFTGINRRDMVSLLDTAQRFVDKGRAGGIRFSTRPDYIYPEIMDILSRYSITGIELGIQSMYDEVLSACLRGHTAQDTRDACSLILERGYELTGQVMLGLPSSNRDRDIDTARQIASLGARKARIYPAAVFRDTQLCDMLEHGEYVPLELDEAVYRAKECVKIFSAADIEVIRLGLHSSDGIRGEMAGGAFHEAFGELVYGELFFDRACVLLEGTRGGQIELRVAPCNISKMTGHKGSNKRRLISLYSLDCLKIIPDNTILDDDIILRVL